jgi:ABC-type multidrug transport system ATPase subunit
MNGMENTTIVETHNLSKRNGSGVLAVDSVAMSVRRGEVYACSSATTVYLGSP